MIAIDWSLFALGGLAGLAMGALYFAGLAWGIRIALGAGRAVPVLLAGATLRIAALLAGGWWIAGLGAEALAGYALAFVALRTILVALARPKGAA